MNKIEDIKTPLRQDNSSKRLFLIRKYNHAASGVSDIIGITDSEEYAKSLQSVFCGYEEIKFMKIPLKEVD